MNYFNLRLNSEAQLNPYIKKMGWQNFKDYMERLYNKIDAMRPGDKFRIDDLVVEENRDLFIKLLCLFAEMHGTATYYFNNEYTWFYRNDKKEKLKLEKARKLREGKHKKNDSGANGRNAKR